MEKCSKCGKIPQGIGCFKNNVTGEILCIECAVGIKPLKENYFLCQCKVCNHAGEAKDFVVSADFTAGTEFGTQYKYITLRCPNCRQEEVIDKTGAW